MYSISSLKPALIGVVCAAVGTGFVACGDGSPSAPPGVVVGGLPPTVSNVVTTPATLAWGEPFSIQVDGSGFDPAHAQIVFSGPGCAEADWCLVPNEALTTKTATRLVGPATLNAPGAYGVAVRNGEGQSASEPAALTVAASVPDNCPAAAVLGLPVLDDNPNDQARWDVPFNPFANYLSQYGGHHPGEDWNLVGGGSSNDDLGKPVHAIANGYVAKTSSLGSLGYLVVLRHSGSFTIPARKSTNPAYEYPARTVPTLYSAYIHVEKLPAAVAVGKCVSRGDVLGYIMNPGAGPHLHFEIRSPEMKPSNDWSLVLPTTNWSTYQNGGNTGYYKVAQTMVESGMLHPRSVIEANSTPPVATYTIATSSNPAAGGSTSGGGAHAHGASVTVTATPAAGYTFVSWSEGGTPISTTATLTFTATANRSLVANFTAVASYTVSTSSSPAAGGTTSGGGTYGAGASVTVTATAAAGYTFSTWTQGGTQVSTSASYTFTAGSNRSLVANFTAVPPQSYTITTSSSPAAGGSTAGGGTYDAGSQATVTATAAAGYSFAQWTENGSAVSSSANYQFTVSRSRALVANFNVIPPTSHSVSVSASPAQGGTVGGGGSYTAGSTATVTANPATDYDFVNWTEGGTQISSSTSYSFTVNGPRTLVGNFRIKTYSIALSSSPAAGGSTSGGGNHAAGSLATVSTTAAAGYQFSHWSESGSSVSTSASYQFTVTGNRSLTAHFTSAPVSLANGEHFRVAGNPTVYLVFDGKRYGYQDYATLQTCTGNHPSVVREVGSMPALPDGGALPSSGANPWLNGSAPVKLANDNTVWVVIGCIKSGIPDQATYQAIFGDLNFSRVVTVSQAALQAVPTGPHAVAAPLRPAGTLIQGSGPEVRWVVYSGGSLGVPSQPVLFSHCRNLSEVRSVSGSEFGAYRLQATLQQAASC